jgi:molybdopterin-biosynthesis enzyme MoeA-like protein
MWRTRSARQTARPLNPGSDERRRASDAAKAACAARVIADIEAAIVHAVNDLRKKYTYVFTTGGIGPTHDDITSASVAKAFGAPYGLHPEAHAILQKYYKADDLNEARLRMAHMPLSAQLIENPVSSAPGFQIENVFVMAGVPNIMQAMFKGLQQRLVGGPPILTRKIKSNLLEGQIAKDLTAIQAQFPQVDIGSYPMFRGGEYSLKLVLRGIDTALLDQTAAAIGIMINNMGGNFTVE